MFVFLSLLFLGTLIVPYMLTSLPASSSLVPKHRWGNQQGKYHDAFLGGQQPLIILSSLFVLNPLTPVCWFFVPSHATATARKRAYFDQFQSAPVSAREAAQWFSIHEGGTFGTSDRLLCHSLSICTQQSAHCHLRMEQEKHIKKKLSRKHKLQQVDNDIVVSASFIRSSNRKSNLVEGCGRHFAKFACWKVYGHSQ